MIVDGKSTDSDEALLEPISSDASGKAITDSGTSSARRSSRRYDVDWLRALALSLLIIYHISIIFQPWAAIIGFSQNEDSLEWLWGLMSMINVWRIPLLFTISGMGVYFAISRRTWRDLLSERTFRIMLPLVFGFFLITPINVLAVQLFFKVEPSYFPNLGHLWFLLNIYIYVILFLPLFFYLKHNPNNIVSNFLREALRRQPLIDVPAGVSVDYSGDFNQSRKLPCLRRKLTRLRFRRGMFPVWISVCEHERHLLESGRKDEVCIVSNRLLVVSGKAADIQHRRERH